MRPQTLDIDRLRSQTPGCQRRIHFNNAGASLPSDAVVAALTKHLHREACEGPMEAAAAVSALLVEAREDAAFLLGAKAAEIAFTSSGSSAWGLAFAALPMLNPGERILVGRQEWGGNLSTLRVAADRAGATVEAIPVQSDGTVDAAALEAMIDERVRLVCLTWLPANGGLINDAAAIGRVCHKAGIAYFIDAGQALGQIPVDVESLGCDVLKGAGRKYLRGPRGTAILYVRQAFLETLKPPFLDVLSGPWQGTQVEVRRDARRFETSEVSVALLLGLGVALKQARTLGIDNIRSRIDALAVELRAKLGAIPGVVIRDLGTQRSGLVSFTLEGMQAMDVRAELAEKGIAIGANGIAYTPLDMMARGLDAVARASVSYYNTSEEIGIFCAAVAELSADIASANCR